MPFQAVIIFISYFKLFQNLVNRVKDPFNRVHQSNNISLIVCAAEEKLYTYSNLKQNTNHSARNLPSKRF
jgi:hypothetical protein